MPDDRFPGNIKKAVTDRLNPERVGSLAKSMTTDQGRHYDARAAVYNSQNEMTHRAERIRQMDAYYWVKLKELLGLGGITYLDFGCATGEHTRQFISGLPNNPVEDGYGVDISGEMVRMAAQALPQFELLQGGVEKIDFENKFDLITSFFHVLGHLGETELELFFQNVSRSLKPGGILCFDVIKDIGRLKTMILNRKIDTKNSKYITYHSKEWSAILRKSYETR